VSRSAVEVLLDADCSLVEKMVLQIIARHGRGSDGSGGHPSARRIALMAGVSRSTLHYVLISLRTKGWISWTSGNARENKANTYTLYLNAIPMLPDLWRSSSQTYLAHRDSPVSQPVSLTESGLSRFGSKPVSLAGHQASTEASTTVPPLTVFEKREGREKRDDDTHDGEGVGVGGGMGEPNDAGASACVSSSSSSLSLPHFESKSKSRKPAPNYACGLPSFEEYQRIYASLPQRDRARKEKTQ
jgi:hypothetical protein